MKLHICLFFIFFILCSSRGEDELSLETDINKKRKEAIAKKELTDFMKKLKQENPTMSKEYILDKLIDFKIKDIHLKRMLDKKTAEFEFTIAIIENCEKGAKFNIKSILNNSADLEFGAENMALHDIKNGNFNFLSVGTTLLHETYPDLAKLIKTKFNLNLTRGNYCFDIPDHLFILCDIYNNVVMKKLEKQYGKNFLGKAIDKYLEENKKQEKAGEVEKPASVEDGADKK